MKVRNGERHVAEFRDGSLSIDAPGGRIHLGPTLAHALGRALLVYANRNGVGRETLGEPSIEAVEPSEEYIRAVQELRR